MRRQARSRRTTRRIDRDHLPAVIFARSEPPRLRLAAVAQRPTIGVPPSGRDVGSYLGLTMLKRANSQRAEVELGRRRCRALTSMFKAAEGLFR